MANITKKTITQGDTINLLMGLESQADLSGGNWECNVYIEDSANPVSKPITTLDAGNQNFVVTVLSSETLNLKIGMHRMSVELRNDTDVPNFRVEHKIELSVLDSTFP